MHCLQWLIPVLLFPKPLNPVLSQNHSIFMALHLVIFFLEKRPCSICIGFFAATVFLLCYSGKACLFWSNECDNMSCYG